MCTGQCEKRCAYGSDLLYFAFPLCLETGVCCHATCLFLFVCKKTNMKCLKHLVHEREFSDILTNVALDGKTVAACLFLWRSGYFAISSPNYNGVVVLYAQNTFLAPSFQFDYEDTFFGHKNTNIKLSSKNLTVPINDICIIQIFLNFVDKQILAKVLSIT